MDTEDMEMTVENVEKMKLFKMKSVSVSPGMSKSTVSVSMSNFVEKMNSVSITNVFVEMVMSEIPLKNASLLAIMMRFGLLMDVFVKIEILLK